MLVLNLTRRWFDAIRRGGKRTEYRAATPYWAARLGRLGDGSTILLRLGYARSEEDLLARAVPVSGLGRRLLPDPLRARRRRPCPPETRRDTIRATELTT